VHFDQHFLIVLNEAPQAKHFGVPNAIAMNTKKTPTDLKAFILNPHFLLLMEFMAVPFSVGRYSIVPVVITERGDDNTASANGEPITSLKAPLARSMLYAETSSEREFAT